MGEKAGTVHPIKNLRSGREAWRIRVRLQRIWELCPISDPSNPFAVQMVFIDQDGAKIEATIKKSLIKKFTGHLVEGNVYKIIWLAAVYSGGVYRASGHEFKIMFTDRTRVVPDDTPGLPLNVFSFMKSHEINLTMGNCDFLADMLGLVTAISEERRYTKGSVVTRMIELELTDDRGKVKCILFGNYVDNVLELAATDIHELPVVIIQYAKIKTFKGDVVIQNVMNATKIYWNPAIPKAVAFRNSLPFHGINADIPMGGFYDDVGVIPIDQQFLTKFPAKSVHDLNSTKEFGTFVVNATIVDLLEGGKWWYLACNCHKDISVEDEFYVCQACDLDVLEVTPRYRIKVEVSDTEGVATFVMFDTDCCKILQQTCKEMIRGLEGHSSYEYPYPIKEIVGKNLLFMVEKSELHAKNYDCCFKVKKICDDPALIQKFMDEGNIITLKKFSNGESPTMLSVADSVVGVMGDGFPAKRLKLKPVKIET